MARKPKPATATVTVKENQEEQEQICFPGEEFAIRAIEPGAEPKKQKVKTTRKPKPKKEEKPLPQIRTVSETPSLILAITVPIPRSLNHIKGYSPKSGRFYKVRAAKEYEAVVAQATQDEWVRLHGAHTRTVTRLFRRKEKEFIEPAIGEHRRLLNVCPDNGLYKVVYTFNLTADNLTAKDLSNMFKLVEDGIFRTLELNDSHVTETIGTKQVIPGRRSDTTSSVRVELYWLGTVLYEPEAEAEHTLQEAIPVF